jgi:hypothetical protein
VNDPTMLKTLKKRRRRRISTETAATHIVQSWSDRSSKIIEEIPF